MSVVERLAGELKKIFDAPERSEGDKIIVYQSEKTAKFLTQLEGLKNMQDLQSMAAEIDVLAADEHITFAKELNDIKNSATKEEANAKIDAFMEELAKFKDDINAVKNAPTRAEGDSLLKEMKW